MAEDHSGRGTVAFAPVCRCFIMFLVIPGGKCGCFLSVSCGSCGAPGRLVSRADAALAYFIDARHFEVSLARLCIETRRNEGVGDTACQKITKDAPYWINFNCLVSVFQRLIQYTLYLLNNFNESLPLSSFSILSFFRI